MFWFVSNDLRRWKSVDLGERDKMNLLGHAKNKKESLQKST